MPAPAPRSAPIARAHVPKTNAPSPLRFATRPWFAKASVKSPLARIPRRPDRRIQPSAANGPLNQMPVGQMPVGAPLSPTGPEPSSSGGSYWPWIAGGIGAALLAVLIAKNGGFSGGGGGGGFGGGDFSPGLPVGSASSGFGASGLIEPAEGTPILSEPSAPPAPISSVQPAPVGQPVAVTPPAAIPAARPPAPASSAAASRKPVDPSSVAALSPAILGNPAGESAPRAPVCESPKPKTPDFGKSSGFLLRGGAACNAFRIPGPNLVVTNNHCTEHSPNGTYTVHFGTNVGDKVKKFKCKPTAAQSPKVTGKSYKLDYTVLQCPELDDSIPTVNIANRDPVVGEKTFIATHDFGRSGRISKKLREGRVRAKDRREAYSLPSGTFVSTVYSQPGNSGSAIYAENGDLLGLLWGGPEDDGGVTYFTSIRHIVADIERRFPQYANKIIGPTAMKVAACQPSSPAVDQVAMASLSSGRSSPGVR